MKGEARDIDQLVRDWHLQPTPDMALFQRIAELALTTEPGNLVPFARALRVLDTGRHPSGMQKRVEELRRRLETLRLREWQIDDLGNLDNDPESLFTILNEDAASLSGFDRVRLNHARLRHDSRAGASHAFLDALGWDQLAPETATTLRVAVEDMAERESYEAWGLFVDSSRGDGMALGIKVSVDEPGREELWSAVNEEMRVQARLALSRALPGRGWNAKIEWPATYVGESLGLPMYIAGLVASREVPRHALTASTGRVEVDGTVTGVSGIRQKVEAARYVGMRRVLVPAENLEEAKIAATEGMIVVPIAHVQEAAGALRQPLSSVELGYEGLIRLIRASVGDYRLFIQGQEENANGYHFIVANTQGRAGIWVYRNGNVRPDNGTGSAYEAAARLVAERVPGKPEERTSLSFELPTALQDICRDALANAGFIQENPGNYEVWRMRFTKGRSRATVILYATGRSVIQGTAPAWDAAHTVIDRATQPAGGLPATAKPDPQEVKERSQPGGDGEPHIGTDEAGKGDYFGPLVSAAVYTDHQSAALLRDLGVRDSKTLSDRRVRELAKQIRHIADGQYAVTPINPRKYNELWEQFRREGKNLNSLLAWGHARSIDRLLSAPASRGMQPKYVVVDQFADQHYIEERTRRAGIPIHQRHKAEADIAVAAASILARDSFLQWLERWSSQTQISLAKGASPQVIEAGKLFVRRWGAKWLGDVAKLGFRTTRQVLEGEDPDASTSLPPWANEGTDVTREG